MELLIGFVTVSVAQRRGKLPPRKARIRPSYRIFHIAPHTE